MEKVNRRRIEAMAEADFNELLLMQDKDYSKEDKQYAMGLYYAQANEETLISILHKSKDADYRKRHWYLYE